MPLYGSKILNFLNEVDVDGAIDDDFWGKIEIFTPEAFFTLF